MTDSQWRDLLSVATHEMAHALVAGAFGDPAPRVKVYPHQGSFRGLCRRSVPMHDPRKRRLFSLAGAIAQLVLIDPTCAARDAYHALLAQHPITLTASDARGAAGFDLSDVRATLTLVRRLWPQIESTAADLARHTADRLAPTVR
jgi:hypothetical protein